MQFLSHLISKIIFSVDEIFRCGAIYDIVFLDSIYVVFMIKLEQYGDVHYYYHERNQNPTFQLQYVSAFVLLLYYGVPQNI